MRPKYNERQRKEDKVNKVIKDLVLIALFQGGISGIIVALVFGLIPGLIFGLAVFAVYAVLITLDIRDEIRRG